MKIKDMLNSICSKSYHLVGGGYFYSFPKYRQQAVLAEPQENGGGRKRKQNISVSLNIKAEGGRERGGGSKTHQNSECGHIGYKMNHMRNNFCAER